MQAVKTQTTTDWDTGLSPALSQSVGPGQFYEWSIPDITKNTLSGLNNRPRSTESYTDIEFAMQVEDGRIFVWESNSNVFTTPDFPLENEGFIRIKIETDGSVLYQYTNVSQSRSGCRFVAVFGYPIMILQPGFH